MRRVPIVPSHPERVCWGCEKLCPADDLTCGNDTVRTPHPVELFGGDWLEWAREQGRDDDLGETAPSHFVIDRPRPSHE